TRSWVPSAASTAWTLSSCRWAVARPTRSPVRSGIAARGCTRSAMASHRAESTRPSSRARAWRARSEVGTPSLQPGGVLSNLLGRVLLGQRRAGEQVFAPREAADEHRLEADRADDACGEGDGLLIVACDRDADRTAGAVGVVGQLPIADRVECAHDARPWQQLGAGQPGPALLVDPLHDG